MVTETSWWPQCGACSSTCWPLDGSRKPVGFPAGCFLLCSSSGLCLCPTGLSLVARDSNSICHGFMDDSEARLSGMKPQQPGFEKWLSQCIVPGLEVAFQHPTGGQLL